VADQGVPEPAVEELSPSKVALLIYELMVRGSVLPETFEYVIDKIERGGVTPDPVLFEFPEKLANRLTS